MKNTRGLTLFEWLVTIGLLLLLIAILLPSLQFRRQSPRVAETTAMLVGLSHDIDAYYTVFHAYPGPADLTTTSASKDKISGNQNLLLGLSYALTTYNSPPNVHLPGGPFYIDPTLATGPKDLSIPDPITVFRQYPPFYSPYNRELSSAITATPPTWPIAGVPGIAPVGNAFPFPAILDRFPDALPILYYRRNSRLQTPAAIDSPNSDLGAYNLRDNIEYTSATALQSASGQTFNQVSDSATPFTLADLSALVTIPGTSQSRGSYILISAGPDRYYGSKNGKSDNIVVVGGQ